MKPTPNAFTVDDPRVEPCPTTGCWIWALSVTRGGYARRSVPGASRKPRYLHRVAWENVNGPIPEGMMIDHICRNRSCINPDHLRAVTPRTNAIENSLSEAALHARKTHCPKCGGVFVRLEKQRRCLYCRRQEAVLPSTKARNAERMRNVRKAFATTEGAR